MALLRITGSIDQSRKSLMARNPNHEADLLDSKRKHIRLSLPGLCSTEKTNGKTLIENASLNNNEKPKENLKRFV